MKITQWFRRLGPLNKFFVLAGLASILSLLCGGIFWYFPRSTDPVPLNVGSVTNSPNSTVLQANRDIVVNSPTAAAPQTVNADKYSPLEIDSFVYNGSNYPSGENISGIVWQDNFVDVRLNLVNKSDSTLDEIDLSVALDTHITKIAQLTNIPNVSFSPVNDMPPVWLNLKDESGKSVSIPAIPSGAISPVYRVYCPRLLHAMSLNLLIVSVALNPASPDGLPKHLLAHRTIPKFIRLQGSYLSSSTQPSSKYIVNSTIPLAR